MVVSKQGGRERLCGEHGNSGISKRSLSFSTMPSADGKKNKAERFSSSRFSRNENDYQVSFFVHTRTYPLAGEILPAEPLSLACRLHTFEVDPTVFTPHEPRCTTGGPPLEVAALYCITFSVHMPRPARVATKKLPIISWKKQTREKRGDTPQRYPL